MLAQRLATQLSGQPLPKLTRLGCEQLLRVCQLEWQLFEQFFQPGAAVAAAAAAVKQTHGVPLRQQAQLQLQLQQQHSDALAALAEPLCMLLYDVLRPQIVLLQDINELCELVDVIKHEVRTVFTHTHTHTRTHRRTHTDGHRQVGSSEACTDI